jgi:hypothetical protein
MATVIFDLTQRAAVTWLRSNNSVRRELLDVFLNRVLWPVQVYIWTGVSRSTHWRKRLKVSMG